jgi:hypothetical protein
VDDVLDDGPVGGPATPGKLPRLLSATRIEQVLVTIERDIDCVDVESRWAGGFVSRHALSRPVQTNERLSNYRELVARIEALRGTRTTLSETAATLNAEGFRPPKRSLRFAKEVSSGLLRERGIRIGPITLAPFNRFLQRRSYRRYRSPFIILAPIERGAPPLMLCMLSFARRT